MDPFETIHEVQISAAGARRLRHGHLWVYAGDVTSEPEKTTPPLVKVIDAARNVLGHAFFSPHSQIRLRLLSRGPDSPTQAFLHKMIATALLRRADLLSEPGSACRLINGEADLLPSIIVDRYGDFLVLQTLSYGAEAIKATVVDILRDLRNPRGIFERNDGKVRRLEGLPRIRGVLWGEIPDEIEISESGLRFCVDVAGGQKTGFFLDQSENRTAARCYARGRALDCFTNTGAFALHFSSRCETVLAVDSSADSLALGRRNAKLNGFLNVDFVEENVFDLLRKLEGAGERFDLVCLDPPAFAKTRASIESARSGYKEINLRALKLLNDEGILVTCSCSYHLSEAGFFEILQDAARDAHRYIQVIERRGQARDHPILASMPETHYLKCFIVRAL